MEFKKLRSQVEVQPFERIRVILDKELKVDRSDVFTEFDEKPVGAGSLGQVYKARLRSTNEWVAVKIQRADIRKRSLPTLKSSVVREATPRPDRLSEAF